MKCYYCGKEITPDNSHDPDDFGLHKVPSDVRTCLECNQIVTVVNRTLKGFLDKRDLKSFKMLNLMTESLHMYVK